MFKYRLLTDTTSIGRILLPRSLYSLPNTAIPWQQRRFIGFEWNYWIPKKCFLTYRHIHQSAAEIRSNRDGFFGVRFLSTVVDEREQTTAKKGFLHNKNSPQIKFKKKLKKNQLGQKGQNRIKITKNREKKEIEKQKLANRLLRKTKIKEKQSQKSLEKLRQLESKLLTKTKTDLSDRKNFEDYHDNVDIGIINHLSASGNTQQEIKISKNIDYQIPSRPPTFVFPTGSRNVYVAKVAGVDTENELFAHKLFASSADGTIPSCFQRGKFHFFPAASFEELPSTQQPEVAFLGRSNVGKSSLINGLLRQPLALTSKHPGRTQQAYYYGFVRDSVYNSNAVSGHNMKNLQNSASGFIVDLPGYGFALGPDKIVEAWQRRTQSFLLKRRDAGSLRHLFLLQDARTGALAIDLSIQSWFDEAEIPYSVVLTKTDCVGPATVAKHANLVSARYTHRYCDLQQNRCDLKLSMSPFVYSTTAKQNVGISELLSTIETEFSMK
jgi:GTP-binding protein